MKIGAVREDGCMWPLPPDLAQKLSILAVDPGQMDDYFNQTRDCQAARVHHSLHSGALHARTRAAEKLEVRMTPQKRSRYTGRIQVPGRLARGDRSEEHTSEL